MRPSQQLPNFAPLPAPCDSLFPSEEPFDVASILNAREPNIEEEALFHCDDIIMQTNAITTICSSLEAQWMMADCMFTDNYLHDCAFKHDASNDNFEDGCSLDLWAEFVEMPIQTHNNASSASTISPACFSSKTFLSDMDTPFVQPSQVYSEVSSFGAHQDDSHAPYINNQANEHLNITPFSRCNSINSICASFSPSFLSCDTPGAHLTNTDCSFLHPSPVFSEASSFAAANQHDPLYISDHTNDHLNMHMSIHCNETSSVHTPILPDLVHGNVAMTYSGSPRSNIATSGDDFFNNEASSFVAFTGPPPQLNLSIAGAKHALNLEERASQPWLNLEAGGSPLHEESCYSMNTERAIRNHDDCEAKPTEDIVRFLVESSTLAIDDGFSWRKYGQKIIKDRAHPRCYFRCAQPDCSVKKQIECSSEAQGYVLITYFGRHNH